MELFELAENDLKVWAKGLRIGGRNQEDSFHLATHSKECGTLRHKGVAGEAARDFGRGEDGRKQPSGCTAREE